MNQISDRVQLLNDRQINLKGDYVLYWMQMTKRICDNYALAFAISKANELRLPLLVYEGLKFYYPWASDRIHAFILEGINEKREDFSRLGIAYKFNLQRTQSDEKNVVKTLSDKAALIVTDDYPCFIIPEHNRRVASFAEIPLFAVDSNGIIPMSCFTKEEYAAYTIRPKIHRIIDLYLIPKELPDLEIKNPNLSMVIPDTFFEDIEIDSLIAECEIDHSVSRSSVYRGGTNAGRNRLNYFLTNILPEYNNSRNKPELDGSSRLSPYLHFGYLSPLEIAVKVKNADVSEESKEAFLEELIVRRELSFNFTRFNSKYNSLESLPAWSKQTILDHAEDKRKYIYSLKELEAAETHDELWNAAQREMVRTGGMHNYVRMLWGKNVIAWTRSHGEAFEYLEHLNNKYCIDGRDPNSYAGILWCFGKHDRPWMEREVFGKIRYMTSRSTGKKFNSAKYIDWTKTL